MKNALDMSKIATPKGNVLEWTTPAKPTVPSLEAKDDSILQEYINSKVATTDTNVDNNNASTTENDAEEEDWLVIDDIQQDSVAKLH